MFSGGGEPTDGAKSDGGSTSNSRRSGMPGGETSNPLAQARQAASGRNSGGAFEDYDEEEVNLPRQKRWRGAATTIMHL